jgi:hypothetical protein
MKYISGVRPIDHGAQVAVAKCSSWGSIGSRDYRHRYCVRVAGDAVLALVVRAGMDDRHDR